MIFTSCIELDSIASLVLYLPRRAEGAGLAKVSFQFSSALHRIARKGA